MESSPSPTRQPADDTDFQAEAADWICRHDDGLTAAQREEFARWMQDPSRAAAYARLQATWGALDRVGELWPASRIAEDPDFAPPVRRRRSWLAPALLAAAAGLAVIFAVRRPTTAGPARESRRGETAVGEQRQLDLSDGSVVQLNTDTALSVDYSAGERRVNLSRGEAHFAVAKNPDRPFVVSVGGVAVRAVGTAFDVRLRAAAVEVLVTEGKVRVDDALQGRSLLPVSSATGTPLLLAGQRVTIPIGPAGASVTQVSAPPAAEIAQELAWQQGLLEFGPTPLREVVAEFNRYNRHQLIIADPETGLFRIGGTFWLHGYDDLVQVLEDKYGMHAERGPDATRLSKAK